MSAALFSVGEKVRRLREERGWTIEDLAEASGLSERQIGTLERDGDNLDNWLGKLDKVALALGSTLPVLVEVARRA